MIKYFADVNGTTHEATRADYVNGVARIWVNGPGWLDANRKVDFKNNGKRHECDARCLNATGKHMNCECKCGGKNHGKGGAA